MKEFMVKVGEKVEVNPKVTEMRKKAIAKRIKK